MNDTTTKNAIDLTPFCDSESSRYALDQPWVVDGWRYATDGRVIVRVPATGEPDTPPREDGKRRPGKPSDILPPVDGEWQPWPEVPICDKCEGSLKINCDSCHGDGQCQECRCGTCHDCGKCDGTGQADCDCCTQIGGFKTLFGKAEIALHFAGLISHLPGAVFLPTKKPDVVVRFKFEGGEGAVMPLYDPTVARGY